MQKLLDASALVSYRRLMARWGSLLSFCEECSSPFSCRVSRRLELCFSLFYREAFPACSPVSRCILHILPQL